VTRTWTARKRSSRRRTPSLPTLRPRRLPAVPAATAPAAGAPAGEKARAVAADAAIAVRGHLPAAQQIASRGEYGLIPRFTGDTLSFLFWKRLKDGRMRAARSPRRRCASGLPACSRDYTSVRIITIPGRIGAPLGGPAGLRRPQLEAAVRSPARSGKSLPRWEAAATSRALTPSLRGPARPLFVIGSWSSSSSFRLPGAHHGAHLRLWGDTPCAEEGHVRHECFPRAEDAPDLNQSFRRAAAAQAAAPDPSKRERYLSLIAAETERLTRLIQQVLDFSSQERGSAVRMKTVDAALVTAEIVGNAENAPGEQRFALSFASPKTPLPVRADPRR